MELVHAVANTTALGLYAASLAARLRSHRGAGQLRGTAGFAVLTAGGYLGGYLSFVLGVNVNHTAWEFGPDDWTAVTGETGLPDGATRRVEVGGAGILLHRDGATIHAIASVCSHAGGLLGGRRIIGALRSWRAGRLR